jgi:NitT/TauT family transport system ATP-binding protein
LETAINWGRYAELFAYDASRRRFIQPEKLHNEAAAEVTKHSEEEIDV